MAWNVKTRRATGLYRDRNSVPRHGAVLRLAVQSGHRLTWAEDRRGSLEVGKDTDLVVLGGNPLTCSEDEIKDLSVDLTVVGGRIVHERASAGVPVD